MYRLILFLLLLTAGNVQAQRVLESKELADATEYKVEWPNVVHGYVTIRIPKELPEEICGLFWYHGTSGSPTPGLGLVAKDFVVMGMSYVKQPKYAGHEAFGLKNWNVCRAVRRFAETLMNRKFTRSYVGGFSKGGWVVCYMAVQDFPDLDGAIIGGAGVPARWKPKKIRQMKRPFSLLVLIGETDPNFPCSQNAFPLFRKMGVQYTYVEFLGRGHTYLETDRIKHWFDVQRNLGKPEELSRTTTASVQAEVDQILKLEDPWKKYIGLRKMIGDPRFRYIEKGKRTSILETSKGLAARPEVQPQISQFKKLRALIRKEAECFEGKHPKVANFDAFAEQYKKFGLIATDPEIRQRFLYSEARVRQLHAVAEGQKKAIGPDYAKIVKQVNAMMARAASLTPEDQAEVKRLVTRMNQLRANAGAATFGLLGAYEMPNELKARIREAGTPGRVGNGLTELFSGVAF